MLQTNASRKSKISSSLKILTFTNICFSPLEIIIFFSCYLLTSYRYGKNICDLISSCLHCCGLGVTPRSQSIHIGVELINKSRTWARSYTMRLTHKRSLQQRINVFNVTFTSQQHRFLSFSFLFVHITKCLCLNISLAYFNKKAHQ